MRLIDADGNFTENASLMVDRCVIEKAKNDDGFKNCIANRLSQEIADRLMGVLNSEGEIIVEQSDLRIEDYPPTNSVEYKRQIRWSHIVRCEKCKHSRFSDPYRWGLCEMPDRGYERICRNDYCSKAERRTDAV